MTKISSHAILVLINGYYIGMTDITERQIQILKAIIEEYIDTAEAVGSETLDKKYNLGISPATIRNEMVKLTQAGFLKQPHTSAGRSPTPVALKFYVDKIMKAKELSIADEVSVRQKIMEYKDEMDHLFKEATKSLAKQTKTMSLAATDEGDIYISGMSNILDMPEFYDIDVTKHLLDTLDEYEYWWNIIKQLQESDPLGIFVGEMFGQRSMQTCGGVFIRFRSSSHQGAIGVVGPYRLNYPKIIPAVRFMGNLIEEFVEDW